VAQLGISTRKDPLMASQWFCKVVGQEVGPLTFQDLAEMVRTGTLKQDDQVRRKGASEWIPAREVIGLFRAAKEEPAQPAPPAAKTQPAPTPDKRPPKEQPAAPPRRRRKRYVLLGAGIVVVLVVVMAWASAWRARQSERFPEPQAGRPRPVDTMENAPVTTPDRLEWDFREGLDRQNMGLMTGGAGDTVCRATPEGIRCTIPPGDDQVKYCGVTLNFGLRGDFQITARYQIFSLPKGEPACFPGLKISIWDANEEWAQMVRQHLYETGDIFNAHHKEPGAPHGSIERVPTTATSGRLRLRRTGTTLHYLFAIDDSDEFVELYAVDFSPDDVTRVHLAAQMGGSLTGIDMIWHDVQIEADVVVGLAGKGAAP
jgi:hypothetical protein